MRGRPQMMVQKKALNVVCMGCRAIDESRDLRNGKGYHYIVVWEGGYVGACQSVMGCDFPIVVGTYIDNEMKA